MILKISKIKNYQKLKTIKKMNIYFLSLHLYLCLESLLFQHTKHQHYGRSHVQLPSPSDCQRLQEGTRGISKCQDRKQSVLPTCKACREATR